jgi:hypothetical protein
MDNDIVSEPKTSAIGVQNEPPTTAPTTVHSAPPLGRVLSVESSNEPVIPYLACLTAYIFTLISTFYATSTVVTYAVNNMFGKKAADSSSMIFSNFDQTLVLGAIATLVISIPALAFLTITMRKFESSEPWRAGQKWRRALYIIGATLLILGIFGALIGMMNTLLTTHIGTSSSAQSYSYFSTAKETVDKGGISLKAIISGLVTAGLMGAGLFALGSEYANKRKAVVWIVLGALTTIALIVSIASIVQIQSAASEQEKKAQETKSKYESAFSSSSSSSSSSLFGSSSSSSSDDDSSLFSSSLSSSISATRSDLSAYRTAHNGYYPTLAQWNTDVTARKFLKEPTSKLQQMQYMASSCDTSGCKSYTLTAK